MRNELREWLRYSKDEFEDISPQRWMFRRVRDIYNSFWFPMTSRYPFGKNVYEESWDALIILDGCRVDAMEEVADEYEFINSVQSVWSLGSASHEWLAKTFTQDYAKSISETSFVVTNVFSSSLFNHGETPPGRYKIPIDLASWKTVSSDDFGYIEFLKDHVDPYTEHWNTPELRSAEYTTERAIVTARNRNPGRIAVQYYQPHRPFIFDAFNTGKVSERMYYPFEHYKSGRMSFDKLWESYINNLRYVLDSVETLLKNLNAEKVIITSDHGELMGEFGLYGHKEGLPHPALKKVPWVETTADDNGLLEPNEKIDYK